MRSGMVVVEERGRVRVGPPAEFLMADRHEDGGVWCR